MRSHRILHLNAKKQGRTDEGIALSFIGLCGCESKQRQYFGQLEARYEELQSLA